jgi:flagellar biosynthesis protein FlhF
VIKDAFAKVAATATAGVVPSTAVPASNAAPAAPAVLAALTQPADTHVLRELHSMRGMIEEQLAGLAWNQAQRRDPLRGHLLRTLLGAGFSARLAKDLLAELPTGLSQAAGLAHVKAAIGSRLPILASEEAMMNEGGVYALMGPTGVGKTTTTAKLAARCVMRFGPQKLALVTTDTYRIGAYEQLRIYGQILGVQVHAVRDAEELHAVLAVLRDKHMVLIDTVGMSQRDRAVSAQIAMLSAGARPVHRLLLLNGASHGDTLNEVVQAYQTNDKGDKDAGANALAGCIFTKVDEATHPGALLDMAIRHQLPVHYVANGQKVPENLLLAERRLLIESVFRAKSASALFVAAEADLPADGAEPGVAATGATSAAPADQALNRRLRIQCRQLIRALSHNVQEVTASAAALSAGQVGFELTQQLWRALGDETVATDPAFVREQRKQLALSLVAHARSDAVVACQQQVLVMSGIAALQGLRPPTLLLSDRTGLPFAAPAHDEDDLGEWTAGHFGLPMVHLLAALPKAEQASAWHASGTGWACAASAAQPVLLEDGSPASLAKLLRLPGKLAFGPPQAVMYRKKQAWLCIAETAVHLREPGRSSEALAGMPDSALRCVVRRLVDADTGVVMSHGFVLASAHVQAPAPRLAQWPLWRTEAEHCFKLLHHSLQQPALDDPRAVLLAAQSCVTVHRLQRSPGDWAPAVRAVLAQLAGHASRGGRSVPGAVLLEGLEKFMVLLDALQAEDAAHVADPSDTSGEASAN